MISIVLSTVSILFSRTNGVKGILVFDLLIDNNSQTRKSFYGNARGMDSLCCPTPGGGGGPCPGWGRVTKIR